ncbi:GNAT family N-acetyltransferase [Streptococcus massiliensis]|uniref:Phosphinothricin acetyltransferase n=1 Tax=Streptococcus massiliensis TaxID=313439 RepID=A0A380KVD2_9STRE|nr:GNAT family N-acetyltransferase [Streptococcus massiliensis]SUN75893.1 phosphinothricin acetyltransferase [Streptococcus massiliensis]
MKIRMAKKEDAASLQGIYQPYVTKTAITFEYDLPSLAEFEQRIEQTLKEYPYLVAEEDGNILGYAYASSYYGRTAYDWAAELSVYLREDARGRGLGSKLYDTLEGLLEEQGFIHFLACIALPNEASLALHKKRGYQQVAHFPKIGYKFEKWHDIVWLQKTLEGPVSKIKTIAELDFKGVEYDD